MKPYAAIALLFLPFFISCKKQEPAPIAKSGRIIFTFEHQVNGASLIKNDLIYTNAAGNPYLVTEVKYFISDITLFKSDGSKIMVDDWKDIFYIDEDIPLTKTIQVLDPVPEGSYDSITFIFGISGEKNKSFMFVNPPESNMAWPDVLGGGYHYMMINGKWEDTAQRVQPFNFHLGIGQLYHGGGYEVDSIYAFVQNYFTVRLPGSDFSIRDKETRVIPVVMNIENWFRNPHVFDFNHWGGGIMQNQAAMLEVKENGRDVFTIKP